MAEVIVDFLRNSTRAIDVWIYLYDRFGRMQPLDYLTFFEQVAVRTKIVDSDAATKDRHPERGREGESVPKKRSTKQEKRTKLLRELAEMERERETIESKLAEYDGALSRKEVVEAKKRLLEVQERSVEVLSKVKTAPSPRPASVFVSYSHADEKLRSELGKHLSVLERQGLISAWHDRMIAPGTEWEGVIDAHLEECDVVLLLVSSDFVSSKYCYDVEMKRAVERHDNREALVIPVILRPVALKGTPFTKLQGLPKDQRPVVEWPNLDAAFVDITEGVREALQDIANRLPKNRSSAARRKLRSN